MKWIPQPDGCVHSDACDFLVDDAMTQPSNVDFDLPNKTVRLGNFVSNGGGNNNLITWVGEITAF
jgi:hypothetical protein